MTEEALIEQETPEVEEIVEKPEPVESLRETIEKAKVEVKEKAEKPRDDKGKFDKKLELPEDKAEVAKKVVADKNAKPEAVSLQAPAAWKADSKKEWGSIPQHIQKEILQREEEVHKGFTKLDEDRQFGKQLKETITPYLATIRAEGGTPVTAVAELLNTAHILRTGDPHTKARAVQQVIQQFGVDLRLLGQPQQQANPEIAALQQKIQHLENERNQEKTLHQQQQDANVRSTIEAFSSDSKNEFFPQVKAHMAALLNSGLEEYQTLEQAYEAAVLANPTTRASFLAKQATEGKKQDDVAAKKRAAVSISGSSSKSSANAENPSNRSLREELAFNMRKATLE